MGKIVSGKCEFVSPPQPDSRMPRSPVRPKASTTIDVRRSGFRSRILPNPTQTGGAPFERNSTSPAGGVQFDAPFRNQYPVTWCHSGHSQGLGESVGLYAYKTA